MRLEPFAGPNTALMFATIGAAAVPRMRCTGSSIAHARCRVMFAAVSPGCESIYSVGCSREYVIVFLHITPHSVFAVTSHCFVVIVASLNNAAVQLCVCAGDVLPAWRALTDTQPYRCTHPLLPTVADRCNAMCSCRGLE